MSEVSTNEKLDILSQIFPDCDFNDKEFYTYCPQCNHHKKKLVISLTKDLFHCWVCNYGGHTTKLIRTYGGELHLRQWQLIHGQEFDLRDLLSVHSESASKTTSSAVKLPPEAIKLVAGIPSVIAKRCFSYLQSRGISYNSIQMYNLHYCEEGKYRDRIILPSYDRKGKLNFFIGRSIYNDTDHVKYMHPNISKSDIIFNELFVCWEKPIILVEGMFDAISINRNAVPLLGDSLPEGSELFKKLLHFRPQVILMLDNDEPGKAATAKVGKLLIDWGIKTFITDYDKKDPGELSRAEISKVLRRARQFTSSDVMKRILE